MLNHSLFLLFTTSKVNTHFVVILAVLFRPFQVIPILKLYALFLGVFIVYAGIYTYIPNRSDNLKNVVTRLYTVFYF